MEEQESATESDKLRYFGRNVGSLEEHQQAHPVLRYFRNCLSMSQERKKAIGLVIMEEHEAMTIREKQREKWHELQNRTPRRQTQREIAKVARLRASVRKYGKELRKTMREVRQLRVANGLPQQGPLDEALDGIGDDVPQWWVTLLGRTHVWAMQ
jgi:hypothetical protein